LVGDGEIKTGGGVLQRRDNDTVFST